MFTAAIKPDAVGTMKTNPTTDMVSFNTQNWNFFSSFLNEEFFVWFRIQKNAYVAVRLFSNRSQMTSKCGKTSRVAMCKWYSYLQWLQCQWCIYLLDHQFINSFLGWCLMEELSLTCHQGPMSRRMQLHYIPVTTFTQTDLFLDRISLEFACFSSSAPVWHTVNWK